MSVRLRVLQMLGLGILFQASVLTAEPGSTLIRIGTGHEDMLYHTVGLILCEQLDSVAQQVGKAVHCVADPSTGSVENLNGLFQKELEFALVQSDWKNHSYQGTSFFSARGIDTDLRVVMNLYPEQFTLIARQDSGIESFDDLAGKRFNVGTFYSGYRSSLEVLMRASGMTMRDFIFSMDVIDNQQADALCRDEIDALFYTAGHPNDFTLRAMKNCPMTFVTIQGNAVDKLVNHIPYYSYSTIASGHYPQINQDTQTFAVRATLMSRSSFDDEWVYLLAKSIRDNVDAFKARHPVFASLTLDGMLTEKQPIVPYHAAVEGLMDKEFLT